MGNGLRQRTDHSGKNVFDLSEKIRRSVFGSAFQEGGDSLLNQAFAKDEVYRGQQSANFFLIRAWRSPLGKKKPWLEKGPKRGDFLPIAARTNQSTRLLGNWNPLRTRSILAWRVTVNDLRRCWSTREIASHPREGSAMIPGSHKSNRIRNLRGPIAIATNAIS